MESTTQFSLLVAIFAFAAAYASAPVIIEVDPPLELFENKNIDVGNADDYRLEKNDVVPSHYNIKITVANDFYTTKEFRGEVNITIKLKDEIKNNSKKSIFLHAVGLSVEKASLKEDNAGENLIKEKPEPEKFGMVELKLQDKKELNPTDTYTLEVIYKGKLQQDMSGFYISKYKNTKGEDEYVLSTQFEPTHARKLVPCFDEPKYKATFDFTLTIPDGYKPLFNTKEKLKNGNEYTFNTTPIMSTYLLAIIVSKFHEVSAESDTIKHAVWNRYDNGDRSQYGLEQSPKLLKVMKDFTNKDFKNHEIGKVDHIALPDFAAGAMENWGLITYRESLLLHDHKNSTTKNKQRVCSIIAHELAHFWFGNLLTTDWWDHTWLNEGFARYFEYMAAHKVEKDWELDKQFVVEQHLAIMNTDSLPTSKALNYDVNSPAEISGKFNSITYNKGASIIRMLTHWNTETEFKKQLDKYFSSGKKTAKPDDLWNAVESTNAVLEPYGIKVADIMNSYVNQPGLPLLTVQLKNNEVSISQERFGFGDVPKHYYYVPISYTTSEDGLSFEDTKPKNWLKNEASDTFTHTLKNKDSMVIVNLKASAYARVNYDETLWDRIIEGLKPENYAKIDVINRAQLVDDALNLARAGKLTYYRALEIVSYLQNEVSYYPWYSALNSFQYLLRRLTTDDADQLKKFIKVLLNKVSKNTDKNQHIDALKKTLTTSWLCNLGDEECVDKMVKLFENLMKNDIDIYPADIRATAYCIGIKKSQGKDNWNKLYKRMQETTLPSEVQLIIPALGCTEDKELLNKYLLESITEDSQIVRTQDADFVFSSVAAGSPIGLDTATKFFFENHDKIGKRYRGGDAIYSALNNIIDRFTTIKQIQEFESLLKETHEFKENAKTMLTTAKQNVEWATEQKGDINIYIKEFLDNDKPTTVKPPTTTTKSPAPTTTTEKPETTTTKSPAVTTTTKSPATTTTKSPAPTTTTEKPETTTTKSPAVTTTTKSPETTTASVGSTFASVLLVISNVFIVMYIKI